MANTEHRSLCSYQQVSPFWWDQESITIACANWVSLCHVPQIPTSFFTILFSEKNFWMDAVDWWSQDAQSRLGRQILDFLLGRYGLIRQEVSQMWQSIENSAV